MERHVCRKWSFNFLTTTELTDQVLHGMHHRHLRPWELFADGDEASSDLAMKKGSFDSLGSSNSYEEEPWVAKYDKRNIIRKIFDREVWIQEPALRQIQDTIFVQALITAFVISAITAAIFLAVRTHFPCNVQTTLTAIL